MLALDDSTTGANCEMAAGERIWSVAGSLASVCVLVCMVCGVEAMSGGDVMVSMPPREMGRRDSAYPSAIAGINRMLENVKCTILEKFMESLERQIFCTWYQTMGQSRMHSGIC